MPFPQVERVLYQKNPLDQVICQLRFSPILKIDAEIPADFQDRVRSRFPNYSQEATLKVEMTPPFKGDISFQAISEIFQSSDFRLKNYLFSSEDAEWKINLTRTFVALTAMSYTRWEDFRETLEIPLQALVDQYKPDNFSRVGLRYIDIIRRSRLGLADVGWDQLIQPYVLGILGVGEIGSTVGSFENKYEIALSDGESIVRIITKFVKAQDENEICYSIDCDFFNSKKAGIEETTEKLDYFNVRASRLFQWCITERLHNAMEPTVL